MLTRKTKSKSTPKLLGAELKAANEMLITAAEQGDHTLSLQCLERGASIQARRARATVLHHAAGKGHVQVCELLLDWGAKIEAHGRFDFTPLHWASDNNHAQVIALLIERGANVHAANIDGDTPLQRAISHGSPAATLALLERGADLHKGNNRGISPFETGQGRKATKSVAAKKESDAMPIIRAWQTRLAARTAINEINAAQKTTPAP